MRAHILVVDDDADARETMSLLLQELGHEVVTTSGAEQAMQHLYSEQLCDVVVSNVVMPGTWGDELALRIRAARPGLPVILVSGDPEGLSATFASGVLALTKPVRLERMRAVLEEVLGQRSESPTVTTTSAAQSRHDRQ